LKQESFLFIPSKWWNKYGLDEMTYAQLDVSTVVAVMTSGQLLTREQKMALESVSKNRRVECKQFSVVTEMEKPSLPEVSAGAPHSFQDVAWLVHSTTYSQPSILACIHTLAVTPYNDKNAMGLKVTGQ